MTKTQEEVLSFIKHFSSYGEDVINCFSNGNCYWFARILKDRFSKYYSSTDIIYHPVENHFATYIDGDIYDITGIINDTVLNWYSWPYYKYIDSTHAHRLRRDCIDFT